MTFGADGIAWMRPPPVAMGESLDAGTAAALIGLEEADLDSRYPVRFATIGPWFVLIGLRTPETLRRIVIDPAVYREVAAGGPLCLFAFSQESDAGFAARMFFVSNGFREDAATGSANTALAAYLRSLGRSGPVVVEQGMEIGRPSRLYLDIGDSIRVGGKVRPVLTGVLDY